MVLFSAEREVLQKRVKNLISHMPRNEIYNTNSTIKRMQNEGPIKESKKAGRLTSCIPAKKTRLKRLTNKQSDRCESTTPC